MARRRGMKPANELCVEGCHPRVVRRFLAKVGRPDANGCWPWTGRLDENGYPQFWYDGQAIGAHRFSHALFRGLVPRLRHVHHGEECKRHDCVNPAHLSTLTHKQNSQDGRQRQLDAVKERKPDLKSARRARQHAAAADDVPF